MSAYSTPQTYKRAYTAPQPAAAYTTNLAVHQPFLACLSLKLRAVVHHRTATIWLALEPVCNGKAPCRAESSVCIVSLIPSWRCSSLCCLLYLPRIFYSPFPQSMKYSHQRIPFQGDGQRERVCSQRWHRHLPRKTTTRFLKSSRLLPPIRSPSLTDGSH